MRALSTRTSLTVTVNEVMLAHDSRAVGSRALGCRVPNAWWRSDPFIGSGTVAVVAQKLGRRAVGVDLNEAYLELAMKRIGALSLPLKL